jgi:hypothetical protein
LAKDHVLDVGPIHEASVNYKSPLVRFLRFVAGSVKNLRQRDLDAAKRPIASGCSGSDTGLMT